ncbi:hypothetical protein RSAG8_04771, partial [Rhizoctonia solani AG-8 WAC10335]
MVAESQEPGVMEIDDHSCSFDLMLKYGSRRSAA